MNRLLLIAFLSFIAFLNTEILRAQPLSISSITRSSATICLGRKVGIKVVVTGGQAPYTYSWLPNATISNPTSDSAIATPTAATVYTVIVSDANSASVSTTTTISLFPLVTAQFNKRNPTCFGGVSGTIKIKALTGTAPYTYTFLPANAGFLFPGVFDSLTFLAQGTYTATLKDANNCTVSSSVTLTQPTAVSAIVNPIQPLCNGNINGGGVTIGAGGTPYANPLAEPYNVVWYASTAFTQLASGDSVASLGAGTYHVYVSDSNGCYTYPQQYSVVTIVNPTKVVSTPAITTALGCGGNSTAAVTVTGSGGTLGNGYTYRMNTGAFTSNNVFTGLTAGTYTFSTRDGNNCQKDSVLTISASTNITASSSVITPIACAGGTGTYSITASGGVAPYTNTGLSVPTLAGTYTIVVTSANGCSATTSVTLTQPAGMTITPSVSQPPCVGGNGTITASVANANGTATLSISGNALPYTSAAGVYTILATDANSCTKTATASIISPAAIQLNVTGNNPLCNGGAASATYTVSGGTGALSVKYNSNTITSPVPLPGAGAYTFTASDANNCSITTTFIINPGLVLNLALAQTASVTCFGLANAAVTLNASGGSGSSFTYRVNTGSYNTSNVFTNLSAGTYTFSTRDANNCQKDSIFTITQPSQLLASANVVSPITCFGGQGTYSVTAAGSTAPYSGTGLSASVFAGIYTITISSANACTATTTILMGQPTAILINPTVTNPLCAGSLGTIAATSSNGVGFVSLTVNGISLPANFAAGTYTVSALDANTCLQTKTVTISSPSNIQINTSVITPVCSTSPGTLSFTTSGGTGTISVKNNGNVISSPLSLAFGTYTLTATDANNCTRTTTVTIAVGPPSSLILNVSNKTNTSCFGSTNGSALLVASNGVAPYSYSAQPGVGSSTTGAYANLAANTYTVTTIDANNCTATTLLTINQPSAISFISPVITSPSYCKLNDGSLSVSVTGGTGLKTFTCAPSSTQSVAGTFSSLTAQTYSISATDANGCTASTTYMLTNTPLLNLALISKANPTCSGLSNGNAVFAINGGTPNYTYNISPSASSSSLGVFVSLVAGSYTTTVTDSKGCSISTSFAIVNPPSISFAPSVLTAPTCNGLANGMLSANASGGIAPLNYNIIPNNGMQPVSGTFINLQSSIYVVKATDANGCTKTTALAFPQPSVVKFSTITRTHVACNGQSNGIINALSSGGVGAKTLSINPSANQLNATTYNQLSAGVYTLTIADANGCSKTSSTTITMPTAITFSNVLSTNPLGAFNGSIVVSASGGTGTKSYKLNAGAFSSSGTFTSLGNGAFTITARDANLCSITTTVTLAGTTSLMLTDPYAENDYQQVTEPSSLESYVSYINQVNSEYNLSIYPNPTNGNAKVLLHLLNEDNLTIKVFTSAGKLLKRIDYQANKGSQEVDLNMSELQAGVYLISIQSEKGIRYNQLIEKF
jgi:hypothetical protein